MAKTLTLMRSQVMRNPFVDNKGNALFWRLIVDLTLGNRWDDVKKIDPTRVSVSSDIADAWMAYAAAHSMSDEHTAMLIANYGPKIDESLDELTVKLRGGWVRLERSALEDQIQTILAPCVEDRLTTMRNVGFTKTDCKMNARGAVSNGLKKMAETDLGRTLNELVAVGRELEADEEYRKELGQADPCFYVLRDVRTIECDKEEATRAAWYWRDDETHEGPYPSAVELVKAYFDGTYADLVGTKQADLDENASLFYWRFNEETTREEMLAALSDEFRAEEFCHDLELADVTYLREERFIVPDTMFLTLDEAKRHIEANHYHYTDRVQAYAMTAWRSPLVERLVRNLKQLGRLCADKTD